MTKSTAINTNVNSTEDFEAVCLIYSILGDKKPGYIAHAGLNTREMREADLAKVTKIMADSGVVKALVTAGGTVKMVVATTEGGVLRCEVGHENISISYFAELENETNLSFLKKITDAIKKLKLEPKNTEDDPAEVWVHSSVQTANGTVSTSDIILRAPSWGEVRNNYAPSVQDKLRWLIKSDDLNKRGKLLLMHGTPGTGKTYFLRSLIRAKAKTHEIVVCSDPERFCSDPTYYRSLIHNMIQHGTLEMIKGDSNKATYRPMLIIMEDAADMVIEESRTNHFDKVSKLLNLTDGLLEQSRDDIFVLTFNEEVQRIDKAFLRPGRCIANIEIPSFTQNEAKRWLRNRKVPTRIGPLSDASIVPKDGMTLAEMYALLLEAAPGGEPEKASIGFSATA